MDLKPGNIRKGIRKNSVSSLPFISTLLTIYTAYLALDLYWPRIPLLSSLLKYAGILFCFLYVMRTCHFIKKFPSSGRGPDTLPSLPQGAKYTDRSPVLLLSFFVVLFSDYFLLFTHHAVAGVILFALIQVLYFIYHSGIKKIPAFFIFTIVTALPLMAVIIGFFRLRGLLPIAAAIYMAMLLVNVFFAIRIAAVQKTVGSVLFAVGLILYCLCDLNVGLINAAAFFSGSTPHGLDILAASLCRRICGFFVWMFYLPAQAMMALSLPCQTSSRPSGVKR